MQVGSMQANYLFQRREARWRLRWCIQVMETLAVDLSQALQVTTQASIQVTRRIDPRSIIRVWWVGDRLGRHYRQHKSHPTARILSAWEATLWTTPFCREASTNLGNNMKQERLKWMWLPRALTASACSSPKSTHMVDKTRLPPIISTEQAVSDDFKETIGVLWRDGNLNWALKGRFWIKDGHHK